MAYVVKRQTIKCPWCGAKNIVRVFSCGCKVVYSPLHETSDCLGRERAYFQKLTKLCGQKSAISEHKDNREAYA